MSFLWNEVLYRPIYNALIFVYEVLPYKDVGLAIIIVTLLIRFILLPLTWSSMKSQRLMQSLNPELEKLKEKYKGNQEKLTQATMDFYKKHKINPLSSCLPLLIQLPILIALYQVLRNGLNVESFSLLYSFVPAPETFNSTFFGLIDLTQPYWPLAIVVGVVQFIQGFLLRPTQTKKKPKKEKKEGDALFNAEDLSSAMGTQFIYIMPIMTVFIAWNLFAGLPLYWITTSIFTIVTQLIMIKLYPVQQVVAADEVFHEDEDIPFNPDQPELLEETKEKDVTISVKKRASK